MVCSCKPRPTCSTVAASAARRATAHAPLLASSATVAAQAPAAVGGEGSRVPPCASSSTACWDAACGQGTGRAAAVGAHSLLAYSCSRGSAYGQLRAGRGGRQNVESQNTAEGATGGWRQRPHPQAEPTAAMRVLHRGCSCKATCTLSRSFSTSSGLSPPPTQRP